MYGDQSIIVIRKGARKLSTMVIDTNLATGMLPTSNFIDINKGLNYCYDTLSIIIPTCI